MTGWSTVSAETINSPDNTGDLEAIALRHGCALQNMEMAMKDLITTQPSGIAHSYNGGIGSDPLWKDTVCDIDGNFWMQGMEVSRAGFIIEVQNKIKEGKGSPDGAIYVDFRDVDGKPSPQLASLTEYYARNLEPLRERFGIDPRKDLLEVKAEQAETYGKVLVDANFQSEIAGLFCANSAPFRYMSANCYFGSVAVARKAVKYLESIGKSGVFSEATWQQIEGEKKRLLDILNKEPETSLRPHEVRMLIQRAMYEGMGCVRNEAGIKKCLDELKRIKEEAFPKMAVMSKTSAYNMEWKEAIENYNMIEIAESASLSALLRDETRWEQIREDYPARDDDKWLCKKICVRLVNGEKKAEIVDCDTSIVSPAEVRTLLESLD
jgi:succinate dehydrogenase / fumarate reductase flavoprotein subunit